MCLAKKPVPRVNDACTKRSVGDVGEGKGLGRVARLQFKEEALI